MNNSPAQSLQSLESKFSSTPAIAILPKTSFGTGRTGSTAWIHQIDPHKRLRHVSKARQDSQHGFVSENPASQESDTTQKRIEAFNAIAEQRLRLAQAFEKL